jgi:phosphoserine phosphatase RsbU/P
MSERSEMAYRYLLDAARLLSSAVGIDELIGQILASSRDVMQCRACSIFLPEPETGDLIIRGTQPELKDQVLRVPAGKGIAGRVFRNRRPENIANAQADSDHYANIGAETRLVAGAMLTIPLEDGAVCHGVMQALNPIDRERFDEFDEQVFLAFGSLIATTLTRMQAQEEAKQQEIEGAYRQAELSIARKAQVSFMPPPRFEADGLAIRVFQEQAADIGGDFYAYHELADDCLLVAVGDACGKGVPAALESARVCTLISLKALSCTVQQFPEWLAEINNVLHQTAEKAASLTTLAVLLIDRKSRRLYCCAFGQARPYYFSCASQWRQLACEVYPPLGVGLSARFSVTAVPLGLGSRWLLLTDGLVEARNELGEQFGERALWKCFSDSIGDDPLATLEERWREFSEHGPERDDATALLLSDLAARPQPDCDCEITPETIPSVRSFCEQWAVFAGLPDTEIYAVALACDEILTNVYKHAYHGRPGTARCVASIDQSFLQFVVIHWGDGLDSYAGPPPTPDPARAGGYGLPFVHRVFDQVQFEKGADRSSVTLVKKV